MLTAMEPRAVHSGVRRHRIATTTGHPRGPTPPHPGGARGFTLLEVLIAFAIAALALSVLARAGMSSLQTLHATARYEEAFTRARSRLAMALHHAALAPTDQQGEDGSDFRWRVLIAPLAATPVRPLGSRGPRQRLQVQMVLYSVSVWVWWAEGAGEEGGRREVRLDTQHVASTLR